MEDSNTVRTNDGVQRIFDTTRLCECRRNFNAGLSCKNRDQRLDHPTQVVNYFPRSFANRFLNPAEPLPSLFGFMFIAVVDGELVLGFVASLATCCSDESPAILFAALRLPRIAGVFFISSRF